jgi:hypothetical protein
MHVVTNVSWLFWNLYQKRILLISIMTIFNEKKSLAFYSRPRPKIWSGFQDRLIGQFSSYLGIEHATRIVSLSQRNAKQLNISNLKKENEIHATKPENHYETKRNFTFDRTKRNFTVYFVSRNKRKNFLFRFVLCFAKQKKWCELETLGNNNAVVGDWLRP